MSGASTDPADQEEGQEDLGGLAMALTGDRATAAVLLGELDAARRRRSGGALPRRNLLATSALRPRRPPTAAEPDRDPLPAELDLVATRLDRLPALSRTAIVLTQLVGLTHAETAAVLDRPVGPVVRALRAGLDALDADPYTVAAVLRTLSRQQPAPPAVRTAEAVAGRRGRRRRRWVAGVVAVAVSLLVAAVVVPLGRVQPPLYTRPAGQWAYGFDLSAPAGWLLTSHVVGADTETSSLVQDGSGSGSATGCQVVAGLPGSTVATTASRRPRLFGQLLILGRPAVSVADGVQWWPGAGVVVRITCTDGVEAPATARWVLGELRFGVIPIRLPFVLDELPPGTSVRTVGTQFGRPQLALDSTPPTNRAEDELTVTLYGEGDDAGWTSLADHPAAAWSFRDETDGTQACRDLQREHLCVEDPSTRSGGMDMGSAAGYGLLLRVVAHTRGAASAVDRSTWFDARAAVPP